MSLPGVKINVLNGQLGRIPGSDDGIAGLIVSGPAPSGLQLSTPLLINGTSDAEDVGIDDAYDTDNSVKAYKQIKDFYAQAGEGADLWIMVIAQTTTMEDICDKSNDMAKKLLTAAMNASKPIRILGVHRDPDGSYTATYTDEIDDDVKAAVVNAEALASDFEALFAPVRIIIGARDFQGTVADLNDFRGASQNHVGVVLAGVASSYKGAAVGLCLGTFANIPVNRNIGRVKSGALPIASAYLSDGNPLSNYTEAEIETAHDKGYILFRKYQGRTGFYFNDDPSCSPITDDYSALSRGRTIDKAVVLTYKTYVDEILDEIELDPETGQMSPATIKYYQARIQSVIDLSMTANSEISGAIVTIDPKQNVLATDQVKIRLEIIPTGIAKNIIVDLGFNNPQNNA